MLVIKFKYLLKILKLQGNSASKKILCLMNVFYGLVWKKTGKHRPINPFERNFIDRM